MKFAGEIILIISSGITGFLCCENIRNKVKICSELAKLCDFITADLSYRITPAKQLLESGIKGEGFKHLGFVSTDNIERKQTVNSPLSKDENGEISAFLYSLGKTDVSTQKALISDFKEYITNAMKAYDDKLKRNSKIYISFGLFFGALFSLIWS
jgi:hypothetical protein